MTVGVQSCHEHRAAVEGLHSHCTRQERGKEGQELWHKQVKGQISKYIYLRRKMEALEESRMHFVTRWGHTKMKSV